MTTTLVKIDVKDKDTVAMIAADFNVPCRFYTIENNDGLIQVEFDLSSPACLFHLGKAIGHKLTNDDWYNGLRTIV